MMVLDRKMRRKGIPRDVITLCETSNSDCAVRGLHSCVREHARLSEPRRSRSPVHSTILFAAALTWYSETKWGVLTRSGVRIFNAASLLASG